MGFIQCANMMNNINIDTLQQFSLCICVARLALENLFILVILQNDIASYKTSI